MKGCFICLSILFFFTYSFADVSYADIDTVQQMGGWESKIVVYRDKHQRIQKVYLEGNEPEGSVQVYYYLDAQGNTTKILFYHNFAGERTCSIMKWKDKKMISQQSVRYDEQDIASELDITVSWPLTNKYTFLLADYGAILNKWKLLAFYPDSEWGPALKVSFSPPHTGDMSYINAMYVNLREKPGLGAKKIAVLHAGIAVKILDSGIIENITPWGKFPWYKIEYWGESEKRSAWVFGAFLEPVESIHN